MEARAANASLAAEVAIMTAKVDDQTKAVKKTADAAENAVKYIDAGMARANKVVRELSGKVTKSEEIAEAPLKDKELDCRNAWKELQEIK
jgi:prophage DNA circulation protein